MKKNIVLSEDKFKNKGMIRSGNWKCLKDYRS